VLNRVAEDRVLPDWFRLPHRRYGTTHRLINLVVGLQIVTIVASRGDVYTLGEATRSAWCGASCSRRCRW